MSDASDFRPEPVEVNAPDPVVGVRLDLAQRTFLDAYAKLLTGRRGSKQGRSDVIRLAIAQLRVPTGDDHLTMEVQRAKQAMEAVE